MSSRLVALTVMLKELGVSRDISTLPKRKRIQKLVYLAQALGIDLGYSFGWYIRGPYSTELTRDYYEFGQAIDEQSDGKHLRPPLQERLPTLRHLMAPPQDADMQDPEWLELLASVHFMWKLQGVDEANLQQMMQEKKPALAQATHLAIQRLKETGLFAP